MEYDTRICLWNLRTLNNTGGRLDLIKALTKYKTDITALQEMRWTGVGEREDKRNKCDIYYSGDPEKREAEVGFAVRGNARYCVSQWVPINKRLCILRVKARFYNISIICAYAPTNEATDEEKEIFYEQLDKAYGTLPVHDMKLVLGDFNAQVGREDIFMGTIGKQSYHAETNENGIKLVSFAAMRDMVISSTYFRLQTVDLEQTRQNPYI